MSRYPVWIQNIPPGLVVFQRGSFIKMRITFRILMAFDIPIPPRALRVFLAVTARKGFIATTCPSQLEIFHKILMGACPGKTRARSLGPWAVSLTILACAFLQKGRLESILPIMEGGFEMFCKLHRGGRTSRVSTIGVKFGLRCRLTAQRTTFMPTHEVQLSYSRNT